MKSCKTRKSIRSFAQLVLLLIPISLAGQTNYNVTRLDGNGGDAGANGINNRGWSLGTANNAGNTITHASVWLNSSHPVDLGTLGDANTNSAVAWPVKNNRGLVVGISETTEENPLGEAFSCWPFFAPQQPTGKICKGFRWENNKMTALPSFPGGFNSYATGANNRGQVVGWAETGIHDPTCNPDFQVLQFKAVIWGPNGVMQPLPPLPGDSVSAATAINDKGQVVGISGSCDFAVGWGSAKHAVLWENGVPINIGDLGGQTWNTPAAINNEGTVVGFSLPPDQEGTSKYRAFVWTRASGLRELDEMDGVTRSAALGINSAGQIVGFSRTSAGVSAVIWDNSSAPIHDLNERIAGDSPYLVVASDINNSGAIAGYAFDPATGASPGFVAVPTEVATGSSGLTSRATKKGRVNVPDQVLQNALRRFGAGGQPSK